MIILIIKKSKTHLASIKNCTTEDKQILLKPKIRINFLSFREKDNNFSVIPKVSILQKLLFEIKFLIIVVRILLTIMFTQINHCLAQLQFNLH